MPHFSKNNSSRPSFGKRPFGNKGGFDRGPKEMHKAECATCGKTCEVPFRPTGNRPVYCNDCFTKTDAPRAPRREFTPRPDQAFNDLKAELRVVNQNLERLITLMTPAQTPAPVAEKASTKKISKKRKVSK
jgi:CxxC-x17-CxxC domain-containing protein